MTSMVQQRRRGRPPKSDDGYSLTLQRLIREGVVALTEKGFVASGLEELLTRAQVPKGSFYYYFASKEAFGLVLIDAYASYFNAKLDRWLKDEKTEPVERLRNFIADACRGMERYGFRRGCLIGNLGQELVALPDAYRTALRDVLRGWEDRLTACLLPVDSVRARDWARFFWTGWEGAVLRARLERSAAPLRDFEDGFIRLIMAP
ncbi:transcriptional regulator [Ameyamaea chiangmaiensis NBRC 103196]|uniref:TetR family transcriptional regulator C-terminal domain-containing protein n=1 Tax=Ameyamaea chiangmaiensis TaxID=442969 RepID=A0A850P7X9_9PROT|nr:TetR/AcrR family transcriptional regulator [Ameyamaea chiangmaiensis]MBS4076549.1 TetR family transcriptional regulator C-terminal domain-containing protein [Ameyamaea chiangmaiensis]NVN40018.1 TetR family transcriptional regulator C-terminal domain-containing protein [Ameyamaea chiangmaiensis]GBQ62085.1 transcriptional regulator [Ameyamaea chiangmaiensis NBRC 103196]